MDLRPIREAIAAVITNGTSRKVTCHAYDPGAVYGPTVIVRPAEDYMTYGEKLNGGVVKVGFVLEVSTTGRTIDSQIGLDDMLSPDTTSSVFAALRKGRTLGGLVSDLRPRNVLSPEQTDTGCTAFIPLDVYPLP